MMTPQDILTLCLLWVFLGVSSSILLRKVKDLPFSKHPWLWGIPFGPLGFVVTLSLIFYYRLGDKL
jgi:uncharacterized BrkB/YihY/UPF0761 family membrane protein